jgi:hypothetical protein
MAATTPAAIDNGKPMHKMSKSLILGFLLALICLPPLHAQRAHRLPTDPNPAATDPVPAGQAPDEMTKKITDLVHGGKYTEAQRLTAGLLVAYPDDQRLIRAKTLLETLLAPGATPSNSQPTSNAAPAQPATNTHAEPLTGMDKVDYNALIQRAREAQQTTDLAQQETLLQQFMKDSSQFLQKYPDQMLLWQLRAASAMSLSDFIAGYEAGQKLLAMGAADRDDSNLQQLLAQLKNKGWMGEGAAEKAAKQSEIARTYGWMSGTWSESYTSNHNWRSTQGAFAVYKYRVVSTKHDGNVEIDFSKSTPVIEVYGLSRAGVKTAEPFYRATLLDSGQMRWERKRGEWEQVSSCEIDGRKRTMTMIFPSWMNDRDPNDPVPETHFFTKK